MAANLIGAVTDRQGLRVQSELDENCRESGWRVTDGEVQQLSIEPADSRGAWNCALLPRH